MRLVFKGLNYRGSSGSIPHQFLWNLWWAECHGTGFSPRTVVSPVSINQPINAPYSSASRCCSYRKDKRVKTLELQRARCLEMGRVGHVLSIVAPLLTALQDSNNCMRRRPHILSTSCLSVSGAFCSLSSEETSRVLWKPKVPCCIHKGLPVKPV